MCLLADVSGLHVSLIPDIPEEDPGTITQTPPETKQEVQSEPRSVQKAVSRVVGQEPIAIQVLG